MAQLLVKELKYDGTTPVLVEAARKDALNREIATTYALKTELPAPFVLSKATVEALGGIKIGYGENAKNYAVQLDADGKAFVAVPWTDTTYTLPTAADAVLGGIKTGFTTTGKDYAVKVDASGNAHVEVPWTDTTYTEATTTQAGLMSAADKEKLDAVEDYVLPAASASVLGGVKIGAGLDVTEDGTVSVKAGGTADAVNWSGVIGRPFNSVKTEDFTITGDSDSNKVLAINTANWASKTDLTSKLDTTTFNEYITTTAPAKYVEQEDFKTNYLDANNVAYKNEIPDTSSFITKDVDNLTNYPTTTTVNGLVATLKKNTYQVVAEKPGTGEEGVTYLVGAAAPYQMWVYETTQGWIDLGPSTMDLSGYVQGSSLTDNQLLLGAGNSNVKSSGKSISTTLGSDDNTVPTAKAVRDALTTLLAAKQDTISLKAGEQALTFSANVLGSHLTFTDVTIGAE